MAHPAFVYFNYAGATPVAVRARDGFMARWREVGGLPHSSGGRIGDVLDGRTGCAGFAGFLSTPEQRAAARGARCPVINYSNRTGAFDEGRNIFVDDAEIGLLAAEHLLAKGYRRFAYVAEEADGFNRERGDAFARVLQRQGHAVDRLMFSPAHGLNPVEFEDQRQAEVAGWLRRLGPPLGILAANDATAANLLHCVSAIAPEILPLLAVVGVDNAGVEASLTPLAVSLTSIEPDFRAVGEAIAGELAHVVAGAAFEPGSVRRIAGAQLIERESTGGVSCDDLLVARLMRQVQRELVNGEAPRVGALAARFGTTPRTLLARFSRAAGTSLRDYLLQERLRRAAALLRAGGCTVAEVAFACGFSKQGALSSHFKRHHGCTPREFQRAARA